MENNSNKQIEELLNEDNINTLINIPILMDLGISYNDIHHIEMIYPYPDKWYSTIYKKGELQNSLFNKIFKKNKVYNEHIIYSCYTHKKYKLSELPIYNEDCHFINEDDLNNPIWYKSGIRVYTKDEYKNIKQIREYYTDHYSIQEMENFVYKINNDLYEKALNN